jgi:hypothetical protein
MVSTSPMPVETGQDCLHHDDCQIISHSNAISKSHSPLLSALAPCLLIDRLPLMVQLLLGVEQSASLSHLE